MGTKGGSSKLPSPPWSYAPSEVAEWLASTASRRKRGSSRPRTRGIRVKGFLGSLPSSVEGRLLRQLERLGFASPARRIFSERRDRPRPSLGRPVYRGKIRGTEVRVRLSKGDDLDLRVVFRPPVSPKRAAKILSAMGIRTSRGKLL